MQKVYEVTWQSDYCCYYRQLASTPERAHKALTKHRAGLVYPRATPPLSEFKDSPDNGDNLEPQIIYVGEDMLIITERVVL